MDHWLVHPWTRRGTLLLSGMLTGLAVCFGKPLGWLAWVSIVPAWYVLFWMIPFLPERGGYRMLWRAGLWFFGAMELTVFHWFFYLYPMSFTGLSKPAALLVVFVAWLGLSALQAVGMALIFPLAGLIIRLASSYCSRALDCGGVVPDAWLVWGSLGAAGALAGGISAGCADCELVGMLWACFSDCCRERVFQLALGAGRRKKGLRCRGGGHFSRKPAGRKCCFCRDKQQAAV